MHHQTSLRISTKERVVAKVSISKSRTWGKKWRDVVLQASSPGLAHTTNTIRQLVGRRDGAEGALQMLKKRLPVT